MIKKTTILSGIATVLLSSASHAYEAGDIIARVGVASVQPSKETSAPISVTGLPDSNVSGISSDEQLGASFTYMITDHIGIEGVLSTPFETSIDVTGGVPLATGSSNIGTAKYFPEVISLQYYPMESSSKLQPFLGIGINYTAFFDEETSFAVNNSVAGPSTLKIDNSTGIAGQLGVDYEFKDDWIINATVWYIDLNTDATLETTNIGTIEIENIEADPYIFFLSIGHKF
ncbi:MAG: OmpW family outer membrane protein [Amphritea sp.]